MIMTVTKHTGETEDLHVHKLTRLLEQVTKNHPGYHHHRVWEALQREMVGKETIATSVLVKRMTQLALELTSTQEPDWQLIAGKLLSAQLYKEAGRTRSYEHHGYGDFLSMLKQGFHQKRYGTYLREAYRDEEFEQAASFLVPSRDELMNYTGIDQLRRRYLVKTVDQHVLELPQERFLVIALHLAMLEDKSVRMTYVQRFYDELSTLRMTVATPTLANAGKPNHQLSSCFIGTMGDSLDGIYQTNQNFARVSKHGGGFGCYVGKIRSKGSSIRGHKNASGGVIPWVRNLNNTAVSVDQLGVRAGAIAVYLDVWHADILDFLQIKTNNGDDRMKAHDVFPGVCVPDLFMETIQNRGHWYLFDPYEVRRIKGYALEDSYDETKGNGTFRNRYLDCVNDSRLSKQEIPAIDLMKLIMKSCFETGTPFLFFRDEVNRQNANKHAGMIYCSNLCTEIAQNMSEDELIHEELQNEHGEPIIVTRTKPGDFVVCNLSSLTLGRCTDDEQIRRTVHQQMRMMDNVIDLNEYPVLQAKYTNHRYRAVGLGTSGLHHHLAKQGIAWESEAALVENERLYEWIAFCAIEGSMRIAREKGSYPLFPGSEWATGEYFVRKGYVSRDENQHLIAIPGKEHWFALAEQVMTHGIRNAYLFAVAPTASTSLISGTTAGVDPIFAKYFVEEKKGSITPQTAPDLNPNTYWLYKESHTIDQRWSIRANAMRQQHVDQAISFNLYITPNISARSYLELILLAWDLGLKTVYYTRNQSVDAVECGSCSS